MATNETLGRVQWNGKQVPVYPMKTIDFSAILSQEPAELEKLLQCCKDEGFFYLDLNNVDGRRFIDDHQELLKLMHRFFESPLEIKNEYGLISPHLGYEPVGSRNGVLEDTRDGYEMVKVSRDEIQRESPHIPRNIKNSTDLKILENAISGNNIMGKAILAALSTAFGLTGESRFENLHRNHRPSTSTLSMMHYIPSNPSKDGNVGHQKHTDISSLTVLFTEQWGLQIRPPGTKEFGFVEPKKGQAIINVGDSLRFASGHTFQSCIHRVVPYDYSEHRYSVAYFLRAEDETMFQDSEGRYVTSRQWHDEKFMAFLASPADQAAAPSSLLLGAHKRNLAGESDTVPKWTAERWAEHGFNTRIDSYHVHLDYPVHQSIELKYANGSTYKPTLEEEISEEDGTTGDPNRIPAFHGYSGSGNASAQYVYVGRGSQEDFQRLVTLDIKLSGKIALAKYGGPFRGLKVKNAQAFGMIGAVIFTDPGDDKDMTAKNYATYPDGPARNPTSIQRGSVVDLSTYSGDPTTPGYPSKEGVERMEMKTVPKIPSLPLSWAEAEPLLMALNGKGYDAETVDRLNWAGGIEGVEYSSGPSEAVLSMSNIMRSKINWIHNAVAIVNGTEEDEVVVVGNHHDAWMIGGAAVSYLNIDVGVAGTVPDFGASPDLHALTTSTAEKVIWPYGQNRTMYEVWKEKAGEIDALGAQSDYTAFVHRGGISAIDMGTTRAPLDPIYHTHSNYDSYHWMTKFADPGFAIHKAIGQFLTLMLFRLVDEDVVPLEPGNYGVEMQAWLKDLQKLLSSVNATAAVEINELEKAVASFGEAARQFDATRKMAVASSGKGLLKEVNRKARDFGRGFISQGGLPGREFYQHLVFAPGIDTGYRPVPFTGVTEAVVAGNISLAKDYVGRTAKAVLAAARILEA
ncbi:N-acetylated-alpha-linked acidic dipeptidase 2 [Stemphylium lycopersici]|nr:2og-fe oxygenase superfamily protein [Stemphylium lycopersici]RAQ99564.1 N-acetylated-alpha-linked acidic dipeptidase 2 [Stemphylium lycopersici]